jgi:hypothetical protein
MTTPIVVPLAFRDDRRIIAGAAGLLSIPSQNIPLFSHDKNAVYVLTSVGKQQFFQKL